MRQQSHLTKKLAQENEMARVNFETMKELNFRIEKMQTQNGTFPGKFPSTHHTNPSDYPSDDQRETTWKLLVNISSKVLFVPT